MNLNTHILNLNYADQTQEFNLRLCVVSQLKLKRETGEEGIQLIFAAVNDLGLMLKIFTEALSFKGNNNVITDGGDFYETLVDNGYCGKEAFTALLFDIAVSSGMIKPEQAKKLGEMINKMYDQVFDGLENKVIEGEKAEEESSFRPAIVENTDA